MKISKQFQPAVRSDSKSSLDTIGVLGDTVVDSDSNLATSGPIQTGFTMLNTETPNLPDVIKSSQGTIEQLITILGKVDNLVDALNGGKSSIGQLLTIPCCTTRRCLR